MSEPKTLKEKIAKLPAWAREHIETLERERRIAVREMTGFLDAQTKSPIFIENSMTRMAGELRPYMERIYVQSDSISIEAHGVYLRIMTKYGSTGDDSITMQWSRSDPHHTLSGDVALIPHSYQMVRLVARERMLP